MKIKRLMPDDLERLVPIVVEELGPRMRYPDAVSGKVFLNFWHACMRMGSFIGYLAENEQGIRAFILGIEFPDIYSGRPVAMEQTWYSREGTSGTTSIKLLNAFMKEALERGCVRMISGDWQPCGGPDLSRTYDRLGFKPFERHYVKDLCQ